MFDVNDHTPNKTDTVLIVYAHRPVFREAVRYLHVVTDLSLFDNWATPPFITKRHRTIALVAVTVQKPSVVVVIGLSIVIITI